MRGREKVEERGCTGEAMATKSRRGREVGRERKTGEKRKRKRKRRMRNEGFMISDFLIHS